MPLVPGHNVDRFVVVRLLGEGDLARVYLVKHRRLGSEHALKLLHVTGERARARFLQEGQVQARIRHANIVAVTDVVELEQGIGLVMDFVDGPSLAEVLTGDDALSRRDIPGLFDQICQGVSAAHAAGVLHGDLKPANILIAVSSAGVQARITDFGIAKAAADLRDQGKSLTEAGTFTGTLGYMAPEQLGDATSADVRGDVFSLGCVVYEMLAGKSPYARRDRGESIRATLSGEHKLIADAVPGLPKALAAAIERAIHPVAAQRFDTVEALRVAVGLAFRGYQTEPISELSDRDDRLTVSAPRKADAPASPLAPTADGEAQNPPPTAIPAEVPSPTPPEPARPTAVEPGDPLLDFRGNRGPGLGSWLLLGAAMFGVGGGLIGIVAHEQVQVVATADANVVASATALVRPWGMVDSRLATAIQESPNATGLRAAAAAVVEATTVQDRIGKGRELVRAVRADLGIRAANGGTASTSLQVASGALDPVELTVDDAEVMLETALSARQDWKAEVAGALGWIDLTVNPGSQPVNPVALMPPFDRGETP